MQHKLNLKISCKMDESKPTAFTTNIAEIPDSRMLLTSSAVGEVFPPRIASR